MRLVADAIKGKTFSEAENNLRFMQKKGAHPILKLLESAAANAKHNFNVDRSLLTVKSIRVDKGPTLKRSRPRSRGMSSPIKKRSSHISIILDVRN